ncbi:MAG: nickel-binding protein [Flavisolibacter sp.]
MPLFMDVHIVPGVTARAVAEAHTKDVFLQDQFACKCMTYWIDEQRESIFCLIDAPDKEAVIAMHDQAHGLVPNKVIEVNSGVVESFLGRIFDPEDATANPEGLKVFSDPSFRILLMTHIEDTVLLQHRLGVEAAQAALQNHREVVRRQARRYDGREVEQGGDGFMLSFDSATAALQCALAIQQEMKATGADLLKLRISLHGGEPVAQTNQLFGDVIELSNLLGFAAKPLQLAMSNVVRKLVGKEDLQGENVFCLPPPDEQLLQDLFGVIERNWRNPDFDMDAFCRELAMSNTQLYRKCVGITALAPNMLLKDYRLEKARALLRKKYYNVAQVTFDSGFSSPSYFTKCFKKKFGLLPLDYLELAS